MKYCFLFFCIIFVLPNSTEQQLVVLTPSGQSNIKNSESIVQIDTSAIDKETAEVTEQKKEESESGTSGENSLAEQNGSGGACNEEETITEGSNNGNNGDKSKSSSERTSSNEDEGIKDAIFIVQIPSKMKEEPVTIGGDDKIPHWHRWLSEIAAGNNGDISGRNPDHYQPNTYPDFNRRFVLQYPYNEEPQNVLVAPDNKEIIPIQAPLELVKKVAKESAREEAAKPRDDSQELDRKKILRTGDYWNAVWVEEMDPKSALRMLSNPVLGVIKAKIKPGSEFYDLVANMKKISPRLLYIIND